MKLKTLLYTIGVKKTPKYSASFAANHPSNGTFYHVNYSDGIWGMVCDKHNGTFVPQVKLLPRDEKKLFVSFDDAARALYLGMIENGNPFLKKKEDK